MADATIRSWLAIVRDSDPDFWASALRPVVYKFSNGREFKDAHPLYGLPPAAEVLTIDDEPITIDGEVQTIVE